MASLPSRDYRPKNSMSERMIANSGKIHNASRIVNTPKFFDRGGHTKAIPITRSRIKNSMTSASNKDMIFLQEGEVTRRTAAPNAYRTQTSSLGARAQNTDINTDIQNTFYPRRSFLSTKDTKGRVLTKWGQTTRNGPAVLLHLKR